ncbi:flavodoxin domain-containing protein [Sinanaerobacter chloroacetimidivorans]|jgi:menaquinone-dependent protoporphyrinogen IX oxidase|uniref:Flavodoxin n=1 Tax=Sinanaerobacter chloroacetimidivorans TaxID=2818044 RepID=A0A8J7W403_9FIRM|nr:flavodoxin domain-containing protein [Sinanaerobacter chloroacetimidivorans]MBR0598728.1 flavodoxin [Sinanaerobacter chloroacetimidivorans]
MKKIAVVYRSKSGFTEKYAKWIAGSTGADLMEGSKIKPEDLVPYDIIVYGGGLYVGGIYGLKLITDHDELLRDKHIIVFCQGATPVRPEIRDEVKKKNFTSEQQERIAFYMLRGGFDYKKLGLVDKVLMNILKFKLKRKEKPSADERGMLAAYSHPVDFTDEKNIQSILNTIGDYIRE